MKTLSSVIQNKILLAILAGVLSIGSFEVWKYNQAKYEKFIAEEKHSCEGALEIGENTVKRSPSLRKFKYNDLVIPGLKQPGINTEFQVDSMYILLYNKPVSILPLNTSVHNDGFFKGLLKAGSYPPQSVMVNSVSMDQAKKQAIVTSYCSRKPFAVSLDNLYEIFQTQDFNGF